MFRQLLIDRIGNAHRIIVDRYSMGHAMPDGVADADGEIASTLRDAAVYLREAGSGNPDASAERAQATSRSASAIDHSQSASVSQSLEEAVEQLREAIADYGVACHPSGPSVLAANAKVCQKIDALMDAVSAPLKAENERLTQELAKSNAGFEEYERKFYLEQDRAEAAESALAEAKGEIDSLRSIIRDTLWMAGRYADGRRSYAVGLYNDAREKALAVMPELSALRAVDGMCEEWPTLRERLEEAEQALAALREQTDQEKTLTRSDREEGDKITEREQC